MVAAGILINTIMKGQNLAATLQVWKYCLSGQKRAVDLISPNPGSLLATLTCTGNYYTQINMPCSNICEVLSISMPDKPGRRQTKRHCTYMQGFKRKIICNIAPSGLVGVQGKPKGS